MKKLIPIIIILSVFFNTQVFAQPGPGTPPSSMDMAPEKNRNISNAFYGALVTGTIAVLSNDIYVLPTYSFNNTDKYSPFNISFGFRKMFEKSTIEIGTNYYPENNLFKQFHLNYLIDIAYNIAPESLKVYIGPKVNIFDKKFGMGCVVGSQLKLSEKVKVDLRYELTNNTNQIMTGIIYTFQDKYFWES